MPAVGAESQHSRIVVHSLASISSDVVRNACAAYSALVHPNNQRSSSLTLFLNMPQCRYCRVMMHAHRLIPSLMHCMAILTHCRESRQQCTGTTVHMTSVYMRYMPADTMPCLQCFHTKFVLSMHAAACHHAASMMHKYSMSGIGQVDCGAWTLYNHSLVVS